MVNIIHNVSTPLFKKSISRLKANASFSNEKQNPLSGTMMLASKKENCVLHMLDKYTQSKTDENSVNMVKARSEYKTVIRRCRYEFVREKTDKFVTLQKKKKRKAILEYAEGISTR